ncbi:hypothetical protein DENSPDRAFT_109473 [Dentipellis sp. KUC8613]|nr:hypothetical protein DENSPDRAFT_109473 [Dentipellis sp. KUC8613]
MWYVQPIRKTGECTICGREFCQSCLSDMVGDSVASDCSYDRDGPHFKEDFRPIYRHPSEELRQIISEMSKLVEDRANRNLSSSIAETNEILRIRGPQYAQFHDMFRGSLQHGIPIVVEGVETQLQGAWGPEYFVNGPRKTQKVNIVHSIEGTEKQMTVQELFSEFGRNSEQLYGWKLKDWPPQANFEAEFPDLYDAFRDAVPFPDFTHRNGIYNVAAHFPLNGIFPDLGPKMYNAFATVFGGKHGGSTFAHLDMTDAVNLMVWSAPTQDEKEGGALWHIFRREDNDIISSFLRDSGLASPDDGPVLAHAVYLTADILDRLERECNVKPWTIIQRVGEAVFIPAGCLHQVSNITDSIKIASDFLSVDNLEDTFSVRQQLRDQRLLTREGDDVLQFYTTIWYAWLSLGSVQCKPTPSANYDRESQYSRDDTLGDIAPSLDASQDISISPRDAAKVSDPQTLAFDSGKSRVGPIRSVSRGAARQKERNRLHRKGLRKQVNPNTDRFPFFCPTTQCEKRFTSPFALVDHLVPLIPKILLRPWIGNLSCSSRIIRALSVLRSTIYYSRT